MSILTIIVVLILVGVALGLVNKLIEMDPKIKTIINVVVILVVCVWLLQTFGLLGSLSAVRIK